MPTDLAANIKEYIHDTYGRCAASTCTCLKEGWYGTRCPNWVSIGLDSYEELIEKARDIRDMLEKGEQ